VRATAREGKERCTLHAPELALGREACGAPTLLRYAALRARRLQTRSAPQTPRGLLWHRRLCCPGSPVCAWLGLPSPLVSISLPYSTLVVFLLSFHGLLPLFTIIITSPARFTPYRCRSLFTFSILPCTCLSLLVSPFGCRHSFVAAVSFLWPTLSFPYHHNGSSIEHPLRESRPNWMTVASILML